VLNFQRNVTVL